MEEISKQAQLEILDGIEKIVEDSYVYPDFNGRDWNEITTRYRAMIEAGLATGQFYVEMQYMIDELGDEHSSYLSPVEVEQSEAELRGEVEFVGVGVYSNVDFERGRLVVISTFPGSPAEYAGIQSHDSILFVDGLPLTPDTGIRTLGPECTAVVLTVQSPGEAPRDVVLIRSRLEGRAWVDHASIPTCTVPKSVISSPVFLERPLPSQIENASGVRRTGWVELDVRERRRSSAVAYPIHSFFTNGKLGEFAEHRVASVEHQGEQILIADRSLA